MLVYVNYSAWKFVAEASQIEVGATITLTLKSEFSGHFTGQVRKQINSGSWLVERRGQDEYWGGGDFYPVIDVKPG